MTRLTIHDVASDVGMKLSNEAAWEIGAGLRRMWEETHGELPPKELRTKKAGLGSHCFATYPTSWRGVIEALVRSAGAADRQGKLPL